MSLFDLPADVLKDEKPPFRDHFGEWLDDMGLRKPGRPYPDPADRPRKH